MNAPARTEFNVAWGAGGGSGKYVSEADRKEIRERGRIQRIQQMSTENGRRKPEITLPSIAGWPTYSFDVEENALRVDGEIQERLMKG